MSEEMARALGANGAMTVRIAGKDCTVRALGIRELAEVERDCVQRYKRSYLETYSANLDLLPKGRGEQLMEQKLEATARWDADDLPRKRACDPIRVPVTDGLRKWLADIYDVRGEMEDQRCQRLAAAAIDGGMLEEALYGELTGGGRPPVVQVPYVNWWVTGDYEGMITFAWVCFRHNGVSRDDVANSFTDVKSAMLVEATREIERLSAPQPGNG